MFPKTLRVSDTLEWRLRSFQARGPAYESARLTSATTRVNVLSCVGGSQTGPHSGWRRRHAPCRKNTSDTDRCGLSASWCTIWSPLDGRRATSGAASELVSRARSSVGRESAALLRSERVEAAWSPTLADRLKLSCSSQASKERTSAPAERRVPVRQDYVSDGESYRHDTTRHDTRALWSQVNALLKPPPTASPSRLRMNSPTTSQPRWMGLVPPQRAHQL